MKTSHAFLAVLLAFAFVGCRATTTPVVAKRDFTGLPPADFVVTVSGTPGVPFAGTIITDGQVKKIEGVIPTSFRMSTHDLTVEFKKTAAAGAIEIHVAVNGKGQGMSSTSEKFGGVRAQLVCTPVVQQAMFTTY